MGFVKRLADRPEAARVEAAGLRWLAEAVPQGGVRVAEVLAAEPGRLELEEVPSARPDEPAARTFGRGLALTHRSLPAATLFGLLPPEHPEDVPALFGPADQLLEMGTGTHESWGAFQASERLDFLLSGLIGRVTREDEELLLTARDRIAAGDFDGDQAPARIHGDLWAGNVLWSRSAGGGTEAVLIDPAGHAGHPETDLAMLDLFGFPHLEAVIEGYQEVKALAAGWEERTPVHQFFPLMAHWVLFGSSYRRPTLEAGRRICEI